MVQAVETISVLSDRPGMIFIHTLDHDQVIDAIRHEYGNHMDGKKYLEKIIQTPFWIPSIGLVGDQDKNNPIKELVNEEQWEKLKKRDGSTTI